jgi:hypothetical protein
VSYASQQARTRASNNLALPTLIFGVALVVAGIVVLVRVGPALTRVRRD